VYWGPPRNAIASPVCGGTQCDAIKNGAVTRVGKVLTSPSMGEVDVSTASIGWGWFSDNNSKLIPPPGLTATVVIYARLVAEDGFEMLSLQAQELLITKPTSQNGA